MYTHEKLMITLGNATKKDGSAHEWRETLIIVSDKGLLKPSRCVLLWVGNQVVLKGCALFGL